MSMLKKKKGGARLQTKEKKPRTRKEKIRLAVILALVVLLALLVTAFAVYRSWAKAPDLPDTTKPTPSVSLDGEEDNDKTNEGENEEIDFGEGPETEGGDRKEDFYTFLMVGRDTGGGGNTDTILLAAYDVANQELNVMSIPRDTMVNVPWDIKRINSVYNMYGGGDKGIQALYKEVSQLVGFVPDYEVVVEWNAVGELVEAIGGVYFDVPRNMNYDDPTQDLHIHINKGYQLLNGEKAMGVLRWRQNNDGSGYVNGDIGRIATQQAFLKAVVSQCLKIENVTKIKELAQVFTNNVQTDLTLGNLVWFAEQAVFGGLTVEKVNFITLPGDHNGYAWCRSYENNQSYVLPDADELIQVVNESFNPYLEDRTTNQLDIMYKNKDGSLSSTSGKVEDKPSASPPVYPVKEEEPQPSEDVTEDPEPTTSIDSEMPEWLGGGSNADPDVTEEPTVSEEPTVGEEPVVSEEPDVSAEPVVSEEPEVTPTPEPTTDDSEMPDWLKPVGQ